MISLLIVDDEKFIRAGLRSIVERFRTGKYQIVEAKNGEDALNLLESQNFHIIISDIKMPKMDGLQLAKIVKKDYPECKMIMLSGFSEFEYAVESMKYGVKDYLLKPVERSKLFEILDQLEAEILDADAKYLKMKEYDKNQLKYLLIKDTVDFDEVKNTVDQSKIKVFDQPFYICVLNGPNDQIQKFKSEFDAFYHDGFEISFFDSRRNLVIICNHKILFERFIKEILDYETHLNVGISVITDNKNEVRKLYEAADSARKLSFIGSKSEVCHSDQLGLESYTIKDLECKLSKVVHKLEYENTQELIRCIFSLLDNNQIKLLKPSYLDDLSVLLKSHMFELLESKLPQKYSELVVRYGDVTQIWSYANLNTYKETLGLFLNEIINHLRILKEEQSGGSEIDAAIAYIERNYAKEINMAMVSNHVSLNYSYFSQLFKEHTGMNFVDYLKNLRIEKAKVYLDETNLMIYEVGLKVGFQNPKHFMKSFKLIVGISPSDYRKKML